MKNKISNHISGDDKKNVYAEEPARQYFRVKMEEDDRDNSYRPKAIDVVPIMRFFSDGSCHGNEWLETQGLSSSIGSDELAGGLEIGGGVDRDDGMVGLERLKDDEEAKRLESLIYAHLEATESPRASQILKSWSQSRGQFWVVVPHPAVAPPGTAPVHEPEKPAASTPAKA